VGLLIVATLIAFYGIRETAWLAIVLTFVEMAGLVFVIIVGIPHLGDNNLLETKAGAGGLFSAAALVMFAYIGFEQIATLSEETVNAAHVIPGAILL
jgi:APA family basic amino acid/polyamine antiporter